jgi:hypothetical protein
MVLFQNCVWWSCPLTKMAAQLYLVYHRTLWEIHIKAITNGFGFQTTLNFKPLTDSSVYTKGPKKGYYPNISHLCQLT